MKIKPLSIFVNLFLLLFALLNVVGQPGNSAVLVEYKYSDLHFENMETLFSNQQEAVYLRPSLNVRNNDKDFKINEDGSYELPIGNVKSSSISYFMNSKNNIISAYTVNLDKKRYIVKDTSIVMEWKIDKKAPRK